MVFRPFFPPAQTSVQSGKKKKRCLLLSLAHDHHSLEGKHHHMTSATVGGAGGHRPPLFALQLVHAALQAVSEDPGVLEVRGHVPTVTFQFGGAPSGLLQLGLERSHLDTHTHTPSPYAPSVGCVWVHAPASCLTLASSWCPLSRSLSSFSSVCLRRLRTNSTSVWQHSSCMASSPSAWGEGWGAERWTRSALSPALRRDIAVDHQSAFLGNRLCFSLL